MATSPDSLPSANILIVVSHTRFSPRQNKVSIESIGKMAHGPVTAVVMFLIACHRTLAISLSSNNEIEELSLNKRSVSCNQLTPNSTIYWTISPLQGQVKQVGMCDAVTCTSPYGPNVNLERPSPTSSSLTFLNVSREWAGTVVCTERLLNGSEQSVNSTLDVYHNSGVNNSSFVINREDWSLTVILTVPKIFSALGNYGAKVRCFYMTSKVNVSLVSYNESSRMYNVGYFFVTLLASHARYKDRYRECLDDILLLPGRKHFREQRLRHSYNLPTPNILCNESYIPEEGPVSCSCSSTFKEHPDARLRWMLGEKVVAFGDYGVEWLPLPPQVVNRSHDRTNLECEVEWLYNMRYLHWIQVAYGPDDITIKPYSVLYQKYSSNETLLAAYPVMTIDHKSYNPFSIALAYLFVLDTTYEKPSQDPGVSHTYEMTRAGHDPRTQESQEQIVVAPFPPCEVYENVTSDITVKPVKAKQRRKTQKQ
ncbi:hypothetical protein C0Q70_12255 [Pomacea canaliculata]|uniref:Uncharacterized protein n=1 Tax=Pomacea canaliculata TaxID=400727 RepID=A0A2T7P111_POMCA|nr:hypothetical protein C0Q70_12255 [Pomacea canaliculata]